MSLVKSGTDLKKVGGLGEDRFGVDKVKEYGNLLKWFHNYLSNRKQLVSIHGAHSSVLQVTSGVPQGSILGPLLFLVYINDLPDTVLIDWSDKWKLHFNDSKCALMHFHKQKRPPLNHIYKIREYPIPSQDTHRNLGIMLQCDLSRARH